MAKISSASDIVKITRHCELNKFVALVDQRAKHSSGLAIHENVYDCKEGLMKSNVEPKKVPYKSENYLRVQQQYENRGKPNPDLIRNQKAIKQAKDVTKSALKKYQKVRQQGTKTFNSVEIFDESPNPRKLAIIRHLYLVGSLPEGFVYNA